MGFVEGVFVLGLVVYFASRFPVSTPATAMMQQSQLARALLPIGAALAPLLPKAVQAIQSFM